MAKKKTNENVDVTIDNIVNQIKELVQKGNIARVVIKKADHTYLDMPLSVSVVGVMFAPFLVIAGLLTAIGVNCDVSVYTDTNKEIVINKVKDKQT